MFQCFSGQCWGVLPNHLNHLDLSQHSRHECKSQCNCFLYPLSGTAEGSNITLLINMILTIPQGLVATKKDNPLLKGNEKV